MSEEQVAEAIRTHDEGGKIWAVIAESMGVSQQNLAVRVKRYRAKQPRNETTRCCWVVRGGVPPSRPTLRPGRECCRSLAQPLQTARANLPNPAVDVFAHSVDSL
jgi:hypothetical protein